MATSPAIFSSILNVPNSKLSNLDVGFPKNRLLKNQSFAMTLRVSPASIADTWPSSSCYCNSATISNSHTLDHDSGVNDEELQKSESIIGSKVRVKGPLKVYHVPKVPEIDLVGRIGVLKQYVGIYKGKRISANLPYQVEFVADEILGRNGKPLKFIAHLREDEFELLD